MLKIEVWRNPKSYDFKVNKFKPDGFDNNWKNNSIDKLCLIKDSIPIFCCKCQSVANYCFGDMATADTVSFGDTIAPGFFTIRCFVKPRKFHGQIHAIINTCDIDGQIIDHNAMQMNSSGFQNGRWLIHDRYSSKIKKDTNNAWSAGCLILSSQDLADFNSLLESENVKPGDEILGEILEQE